MATLIDVVRRLDGGWVAEVVPEFDRTGCPPGQLGHVIEGKFEVAQWAKARKRKFEKMTVDEAMAIEYVRGRCSP